MDALPVLPVAVPLLVAAVLVGLGTVCPRQVADTAALATAAASAARRGHTGASPTRAAATSRGSATGRAGRRSTLSPALA